VAKIVSSRGRETTAARRRGATVRSKARTSAVTAAAVMAALVTIVGATSSTPDPTAVDRPAAPGARVAGAGAGLASWYAAAPYLTDPDNPPDLRSVMAATGQRTFTLPFVLAATSGGCVPTWNGDRPVADDAVRRVVADVRAAGGDVVVSFGGFGGAKLGQNCTTPRATADAYQQVVDAYRIRAVDFDLEAPGYQSSTALANEVGAAQILRQRDPGLYVSVTTSGTTAGTGWFGQQILNLAKSLRFVPDNYTIMAFDNGFSGDQAQITALEDFHRTLMSTFDWNAETAYAHEGFLGMNGRTDAGEVFTQSDFRSVLGYALAHRLGRFTFWAVDRDRPCDPPAGNAACSDVAQAPWEFTAFTARFGDPRTARDGVGTPAGRTVRPAPVPPRPTTTRPPVRTACTALPWNLVNPYVGGTIVAFGGHAWTAKWWNQGEVPGDNPAGAWVDNGPCIGPSRPVAACTASPWSPNATYTDGDTVSHAGRAWRAKWWTHGDEPGANRDGVWVDEGPCAGR
jgi:chitinase